MSPLDVFYLILIVISFSLSVWACVKIHDSTQETQQELKKLSEKMKRIEIGHPRCVKEIKDEFKLFRTEATRDLNFIKKARALEFIKKARGNGLHSR